MKNMGIIYINLQNTPKTQYLSRHSGKPTANLVHSVLVMRTLPVHALCQRTARQAGRATDIALRRCLTINALSRLLAPVVVQGLRHACGFIYGFCGFIYCGLLYIIPKNIFYICAGLMLMGAAVLAAGTAQAQEAWGGVVSVKHVGIMDRGHKVAIVARTTDGSSFQSHAGDISVNMAVTARAIEACAEQGRDAITSGAGMDVVPIAGGVGGVFYIPCRR